MHNFWISSVCFVWIIILLNNSINCQGQDNPVGAHRLFGKTTFSCLSRPPGYYADIETGCQVYHMCDGLGRQFSYSCPNTTLFQQRMLVCDHWYMVNCSKAESDYDANLLIGQRDKPFVPDGEQQLRTPRPDLLDRPYAPDYSGESFRNQYKRIPLIQNQLDDSPDGDFDDRQILQMNTNSAPSSTRWHIAPPARNIQPPSVPEIALAIRRMDENDNSDLGTSFSSHYNTSADVTSEEDKNLSDPSGPSSSTSFDPQIFFGTQTNKIPTQATTQKPAVSQTARPTFSIRQRPTTTIRTTTPQRFDYQSSSDTTLQTSDPPAFDSKSTTNAYQKQSSQILAVRQQNKNKLEPEIKVPSRLYEPPFLYPILNQNYTQTPFGTSTAAPFSRPSTVSTTRAPPLTKPTTSAGRPFAHFSTTSPTTTDYTSFSSQQAETLQHAESSNPTRNSFNSLDYTRFESTTTTIEKLPKQVLGSKNNFLQPPPTRPKAFQSPSTLPQLATTTTKYVTTVLPIVVPDIPENLDPNEEKINLPSSILDYNIPPSSNKLSPSPFTPSRFGSNVGLPTMVLQPPFPEYVQHDTATTQGPPIYYQWKLPSNALEPPKLDPPIGVDGRTEPDYFDQSYNDQTDPNETFSKDYQQEQDKQLNNGDFGARLNLKQDLDNSDSSRDSSKVPQPGDNQFVNNPFLSNLATKSQRSIDSATKSSTDSPIKLSKTKKPKKTATDIQQLKRDFSIPEFLFPLENEGRTGYESVEPINSFQLKIPKRRNDDGGSEKKWYGENPECPECHPSFVKPGTCEPCVKTR